MAPSLDIDSLTLLILSCLCPLNSKEENILGKKVFIIDDRPCIIDLLQEEADLQASAIV